MTALMLLVALAAGCGAGGLVLALLAHRERRRDLAGRLARVVRANPPERPAGSRLRELEWQVGRQVSRRLPARWLSLLRHRLATAGLRIPTELFLGRWLLIATGGVLLAGGLARGAGLPTWLMAVALLAAGGAPLWHLALREADRLRRMRKAFPFLLDFLSMTMEAGLSLESGLARAAEKLRGPLADELGRYLQNLNRGMSRQEALTALAEGVGLPEVREFVRVLVQADRFGLPLAEVLRSQALEFREERRLQAQEAAQKIPVKLLFPLVLFILPSLFLLVLGPAVLWAVARLGQL